MVFKTSDDHSVALYNYIPLFGLHVWCQRCWYDIHLYEDMNPVLSNAFLCRRCCFFYVASCLCVSTVDGGGPCWRLCFCLCLCCLCLSLSFYHIRVFSTADGGWVPAGGGVPSSFCLQSPKTDCGRKAFSQYCRQQAKSPTKAPSVSRYSRN